MDNTANVISDKLSVAKRAPENTSTNTKGKPATFNLSKDNRIEFVSNYTGITDNVQRRANRTKKISRDKRKGVYKNRDTRKHEANHAKYLKRKY